MKSALLAIVACAGLAGCVGYGGTELGTTYHGQPAYGWPSTSGYVYSPGYYDGRSGAYWGGTTTTRPLRDRDGDGIPNRLDNDRDNDGVPNHLDARPNNPRRQ
jgi:hypothetical protein